MKGREATIWIEMANSYFDVLGEEKVLNLHLIKYFYMGHELIGLLVPAYILEHFEYKSIETISGVIRIHLTEKEDASHYPKAMLGKGKIVKDGFINPIELQSYPTLGKEVFLVLKRRR